VTKSLAIATDIGRESPKQAEANMADHDVTFTLPERELGKADIELKVKADGHMFGRLRLSNGSMVWVPANKKFGFKVSWSQFDELMQGNGKAGHQ
jgi:hypothetical protein